MPKLPAALMKPISDAIQIILVPSARRLAPGLLALTQAVLLGHSKSREEMILDAVEGQIAAHDRRETAIERLRQIAADPNVEYQRILAREAARHVPVERFIMPALPIAGRIFRDSEFDEPGSSIWEMWVQLLARACDRDRVDQAHPAFPWIISQLSGDEARLLSALSKLEPRTYPPQMLEQVPVPSISSSAIGLVFPSNIEFYLGHIGSLGLAVLPMGWAPNEHLVVIDEHVRTYMLSDFGHAFMSAVSPPLET